MEILLAIIFIVFGILQIVLFFKLWGMTNDIREIKEKYLSEGIARETKSKGETLGKFHKDDLVILISSGKQMRVKDITSDGKYSCFTNNGVTYEGDFTENEIKLF